jgi:hypothetical protein
LEEEVFMSIPPRFEEGIYMTSSTFLKHGLNVLERLQDIMVNIKVKTIILCSINIQVLVILLLITYTITGIEVLMKLIEHGQFD